MNRVLRRWPVILLLFFLAAVAVAAWVLFDLPDLASLPDRVQMPSVRITDREGRLLYEALPAEGGRHSVVSLEEIPLALRQATVATEDSQFYTNAGVDLAGIARAVWINLRGGEALSGGSTITQQVARNLLLDSQERGQRSLRRKLRETLLAYRLTRRYSKDEILALYLNQMYYGGLTYGVDAAAQTYFGKPVSQLDLAECALLAGLPQSPNHYNPFTDLQAARQRQQVVLGLMEKAGFIDARQRQLAATEPLVLTGAPYPMEAPHFVVMVREQVDALVSSEQVRAAGGLTVRTTLNLDWQRAAEQAVQDQFRRLRESASNGLGHNVNNAALVALDPASGEILAMVGSPDYDDTAHAGALNMALAPRQPGSALKPLIYAAAFDPLQPRPWTAGSLILDVTTAFRTHDGLPYTPVNYDGLEHGPVLVREALASSLNIPAVTVLDAIGLPRLFSFASRLGITTLGNPQTADLSIALGGGDVRLLDLTAAYGAFATGGYRVDPSSILEIRGQNGQVIYTPPSRPSRQRVMDARVAWLISDILSDDSARLLGFGHDSVLKIDRPAAVKTGTTTNWHDNWTVGYTPDLVVGVWAGNTNHDAMRDVTGLTGAAPIWHQFIRTALNGRPEQAFLRPEGLEQVEICAISGKRRTEICPDPRSEWFITGTAPTEPDDVYRVVELDTGTGRLANENTLVERRITDLVLALPPRAEPWARRNGVRLLADALPAQTGAAGASPGGLRLVSPANGAIFTRTSAAAPGTQQIPLQALASAGARDVVFYLDGARIGAAEAAPFEAWWELAPGQHTAWVEAVAADGARLVSEKIMFTVK